MAQTVSSSNKYVSPRLKNSSYTTRVFNAYPILIELLRRKGVFEVRARDACIYLGLCSHYILTSLGCLLNLLSRLGLAEKHNRSRPIRYTVDRLVFSRYLWLCRIDRGEDYCIESGCSGLGICPYWRIKRALLG